MSHYAEYRAERENAIVIEDENGFASAIPFGDYYYIDEIYVIPEKRKSNIASTYAKKHEKIAKHKGYEYILGSVDPKANGSTISLKVLLAYGFELLEIGQNGLIYLTKKIGE